MNSTLIRTLLSIVFMLSATVSTFAYDFEAKNSDRITIYYNKLSDTECEVTSFEGIGKSYSGSITIPSSVKYGGSTFSVTSIGASAFARCESLTSITLPNCISIIGNSAFFLCI